MAFLKKPSVKNLTKTIEACLENASRLTEETYCLEFLKPPATRFYLAMISQEESAKAFILMLIRDDIIPFTASILRAINDHTSKQLIGLIMDYMIMKWDTVEELKALVALDSEMGGNFPDGVASALEILRYEKVERWHDKNCVWGDNADYDKFTLAVAQGKIDRKKQDALYVGVGRDGRPSSVPSKIVEHETMNEIERSKRYMAFVRDSIIESTYSPRIEKTLAAFRFLFASHFQKMEASDAPA